MQMKHKFCEPAQRRPAALHSKVCNRDTNAFKIVPKHARFNQRYDIIAEARPIKILNEIDQSALGTPDVEVVDQMTDADQKSPPRQKR
jgi:hypothetical protein